MQGSWNHRVSIICFAFCHVSCLRLMSVVGRSPPLSPWPCGLRIVQGLVQALLFMQGEKSAALVGCPTVSSQAKPSTASKNGFPKGKKLATKDLPGKRHSTCCTEEVSSQNAEHLQPRFGAGAASILLSSSNMVQMGQHRSHGLFLSLILK